MRKVNEKDIQATSCIIPRKTETVEATEYNDAPVFHDISYIKEAFDPVCKIKWTTLPDPIPGH